MDDEVAGAPGAHTTDLDGVDGPPVKRRGRMMWLVAPVVLVLAGGAAFVAKQVHDVTSSPYKTVTYSIPDAPHLVATRGESVYRIDPSKSSLSYEISEKIAGRSVSKAIGTTNGIAGDLAVNRDEPSKSRLGSIVANIEQFHSDNRLRDARIRSDFLQSHAYPLATFSATSLEGLPATLVEGKATAFTIVGDAKVHGVTHAVTWDATGTLHPDGVDVTATAKIKLTDFGVSHVSIQGLVSASNDATLTMKIHAVDPAKVAIPRAITGPEAKASGTGPSFSKVVMPILEDHCAECHKPGEVGAVHWQMKTAGDVAKISEGIQTVTETKYMPPWPASTKGVPLAHPNILTKAQITAIGDWAKAGGKLDVPERTLIKPSKTVQASMPRADERLLIPAPYTGRADEENDYRCFVLDPKITKPTFLTGYGFIADQVQELHHAQVFLFSAEQKKNALAMSGKDGKPGWSCFGTPGAEGRPATAGFSRRRDAGYSGQDNLVAGWVPGQTPTTFGKDLGVMMEPGDALILQIHYHYEGKPTPDRSGLTLQLDPGTAARKKIRVVNPLAPVEIPCAPGIKAKLCDRSEAIKDNVRLYGPIGSYAESGLLGICGKTPEELTKDFDGEVAHSECLTSVPESGDIIAVLGHMHTLGKSFRLTLDPGGPNEKILLDIPVWNFDWQMNYPLVTPIHVEAGEKVLMQCSWDRSLDPNRPPKYIVFAEGTEDEMCFGTYAMVPDNQAGR
jgi:polyisoprenoid-binding protein YceI/mono/diheme cytochrome c family protein